MVEPAHTLGALGAVVKNGTILLVHTDYLWHKWQLPGGFVEKNESPIKALQREFKEELGVEINILYNVGIYISVYDNNIILLYRISTLKGELNVDGTEVLEARYFSLNNLPSNISRRTYVMISDVLSGRRGRVKLFNTREDKGISIDILYPHKFT